VPYLPPSLCGALPPLTPPPPTPPVFPYTTLFRSLQYIRSGGRVLPGPGVPGRPSADAHARQGGLLRSRPVSPGFKPQALALWSRSEEHTSELQSRENLVCRLLLE